MLKPYLPVLLKETLFGDRASTEIMKVVWDHMGAILVAQMVKSLPAMWETQVRSLGPEYLLEKGMATHSTILVWRIHAQRSLANYSLWGLKESDTMSDFIQYDRCSNNRGNLDKQRGTGAVRAKRATVMKKQEEGSMFQPRRRASKETNPTCTWTFSL